MASSQFAPDALLQPSLAGFGRRTAAYLVDALIAFVAVVVAAFAMRGLRIIGVWTPREGLPPDVSWKLLGLPSKLSVILAFVVSMGAIYWALFEASPWQASIGKRLFDIYVTDESGRRITLARSFGRSFAKCLFNTLSIGFVSVITVLVSAKKQGLHDFACKTLVLSGRPAAAGSLELWRIVAAFAIPVLWLVGTFLSVFRSLN